VILLEGNNLILIPTKNTEGDKLKPTVNLAVTPVFQNDFMRSFILKEVDLPVYCKGT